MAKSDGSSDQDRKAGTKVSRRDACKLGLAAAVTAAGGDALGGLASPATDQDTGRTPKSMNNKPHIAVVGAGAFGGWTALYLLRSGARVTLLDAWVRQVLVPALPSSAGSRTLANPRSICHCVSDQGTTVPSLCSRDARSAFARSQASA